MAFFPQSPVPSSISAPAVIDPMWSFETDSGYQFRRPKHSRSRRRFLVEWLGKTTIEMHQIRDFVQTCRLGALSFSWIHNTAFDQVIFDGSTTPAVLQYPHGLVTGQWIGVFAGPANLNGFWQITRLDAGALILNGSQAGGGIGYCFTFVYLPTAVAMFQGDTWESPAKLIGPEQTSVVGGVGRIGVWNFSLLIEEVF